MCPVAGLVDPGAWGGRGAAAKGAFFSVAVVDRLLGTGESGERGPGEPPGGSFELLAVSVGDETVFFVSPGGVVGTDGAAEGSSSRVAVVSLTPRSIRRFGGFLRPSLALVRSTS